MNGLFKSQELVVLQQAGVGSFLYSSERNLNT